MTTQIDRLREEISAFSQQVQALEAQLNAPSAPVTLEGLNPSEIAETFISAAKNNAPTLERYGIRDAIAYFRNEIETRRAKLAQLQEQAQREQLEQTYAEGCTKMHNLAAQLEAKRADISAIMQEIKAVAVDPKYKEACRLLTGFEFWNYLCDFTPSATVLTQLDNGATWGIGLQRITQI